LFLGTLGCFELSTRVLTRSESRRLRVLRQPTRPDRFRQFRCSLTRCHASFEATHGRRGNFSAQFVENNQHIIAQAFAYLSTGQCAGRRTKDLPIQILICNRHAQNYIAVAKSHNRRRICCSTSYLHRHPLHPASPATGACKHNCCNGGNHAGVGR
jgi:hypothetical protein